MKKYIVLLIVLLISGAAEATALRGVSIGDDCKSTYDLEQSQGSRLKIDGKMKIFEGIHEGYPALISYNCANGKTSLQNVNITYFEDSEAKNRVKGLEREYIELYGFKPVRDVDDESVWLVWKTTNAIVTVSALHGGEGSELYSSTARRSSSNQALLRDSSLYAPLCGSLRSHSRTKVHKVNCPRAQRYTQL
ncbi:hypothetical protein [Microbulbifer taiwanensis]